MKSRMRMRVGAVAVAGLMAVSMVWVSAPAGWRCGGN